MMSRVNEPIPACRLSKHNTNQYVTAVLWPVEGKDKWIKVRAPPVRVSLAVGVLLLLCLILESHDLAFHRLTDSASQTEFDFAHSQYLPCGYGGECKFGDRCTRAHANPPAAEIAYWNMLQPIGPTRLYVSMYPCMYVSLTLPHCRKRRAQKSST